MNMKKRLLSALLTLCMVLALLPVSTVAAEEYGTNTIFAQLTDYDSASGVAFFSDGQSAWILQTYMDFPELATLIDEWLTVIYDEESNGILEIRRGGDSGNTSQGIPSEPAHVELSAAVDISIKDVERYEDTYRIAGTKDAFEDAAAFRLPFTITVMNTTKSSGASNTQELIISSIELAIPERFILEMSENERARLEGEDTLAPGQRNEYDGYLRVDDSTIMRQSKELKYTVSAKVKSNLETLEGKTTFTVTPVTPEEAATSDEEYDWLPVEKLPGVTDPASAAAAVKEMTKRMTDEQKKDPDCVNLAALFTETAAARAARKTVVGKEIEVSAASVKDLEAVSVQALKAVEPALSSGGVTAGRGFFKTVILITDETDISIRVDPDILTTQVEKVQVETPSYALTLKIEEFKDDLTESLTFQAQEVVSSYALKKGSGKTTINVNLPKAQMTNPVTVSFPKSTGATTYQAIVKTDGSATASKFNPVTTTMDGKVNTSGTYTVKTNEKSFSDISGKSAEMQKAILFLASKGIISGTSATEFSPDRAINRQQIAALLMRALGKVDSTATTTFTDVPKSSGLYHAIASSQKHGIINGYSDNTFRGGNVISKSQIVTVSGRVLTSEMKYKTPSNPGSYLGKYKDTVPAYAQDMVALATREGLVVYRTDGTFSGDKNMTRGDAAVILYRLFQRIW